MTNMNRDSKQKKNAYTLSLKKVYPTKKWKLLRLISRVKDFPRFMPNVKECSVISKTRNGAITLWHIELGGVPLRWKQEDRFDFKHFRINFHLLEGDLAQLEGEWKLVEHASGETELSVQVTLRVGLPQIEEIVGPMVANVLRQNFEAMLEAFGNVITMQRYRRIADRKTSDVSGFAVMCHPYNFNHLVSYLQFFNKDLKLPSREFLAKIFELTPSYASVGFKEFRSKTGKITHGYFIMCPFVPDMLAIDIQAVMKKVIEACKVAERLGLGILALGGFTSIAAEMNNKSIRQFVHMPVTSGNTYTVALALQGVRKACELMGIDLRQAKVTIIGGAGDIGGGCARILAEEVKEITITSRNERNLVDAERTLSYIGHARIKTCLDNQEAVKDADVIIAAASSTKSIVAVEDFKSGAVVCDIGYPKNISYEETDRKDILIFSGGICAMPCELDFGFDVGLPSKKTMYGCYAEGIILDLEEKYINFSEGRGNITKEKVAYISVLAQKHGFELAPFFWGNKLLHEKDLAAIRSTLKTRRVGAS